jgi:hypothetical protein
MFTIISTAGLGRRSARRALLQPANTRDGRKIHQDMDAVRSLRRSFRSRTGLMVWDKAKTIRLARYCNEFAAKMVQQHPTRFGFFGAMPPGVDATLKEIAHAYGPEGDGIGFLRAVYLAAMRCTGRCSKIDRRNAVVHVHPTAGSCGTWAIWGLLPSRDGVRRRRHRPSQGFASAETPASPTFDLSHGGGTVLLAGRIDGSSSSFNNNAQRAPVRKVLYSLARSRNAGAVASLQKLVSGPHMFGTVFHLAEGAQLRSDS